MEMASGAYPEHLAALVKEGKVTTAQLDTAVRRVLAIKVRMGLFENPYTDEARAAQVSAHPSTIRKRASPPSARWSCCATRPGRCRSRPPSRTWR